jgi:hypothetical protein
MSEESQRKIVSNNSEDSMFCPPAVNKKLEEMIQTFGLPIWILKDFKTEETRKCRGCNEPLSWISIRGVSICLNAQHFGDVQVEILCRHCSLSYFLNFRKTCKNSLDFSDAIRGPDYSGGFTHKYWENDPVFLDEIKPSENNLVDVIIAEKEKEYVNG